MATSAPKEFLKPASPAAAEQGSIVDRMTAKLLQYEDKLKAYNNPLLELIYKQSDGAVKRSYAVMALGSTSTLAIWLAHGPGLVSDLVGFVFPAYYSFKAIETTEDARDDKQWLTYWVAYALVQLSERMTSFFTSRIQLYHPLKICLLVWLAHPSSRGAEWVYQKIIRPYLLRIQKPVDQVMEQVGGAAGRALGEAKAR